MIDSGATVELTPYLAHAGHWLTSIAFAVPVLLVPAALALAAIDRRRGRAAGAEGQRRSAPRSTRG